MLPCPRDCPLHVSIQSGKPVCTGGKQLEAALHWLPFKELRSHATKKGYMADETTCPSDSRSWFPRLVPLTGFTLGDVWFRQITSDCGAASQLVSQPRFPGVLAHRLPLRALPLVVTPYSVSIDGSRIFPILYRILKASYWLHHALFSSPFTDLDRPQGLNITLVIRTSRILICTSG